MSSSSVGADSGPSPDQALSLFLDANALFSDWQRALWQSFRQQAGHWTLGHSVQVLDECFRNLVRLGHLSPEGAATIRTAWECSPGVVSIDEFDAYRADVRSVDEKDRHVAAAALKWRHQCPGQGLILVTWNIRDFPRPALRRLGIERLSPDECVFRLLKTHPEWTRQAVIASLSLAQQAKAVLGEHQSVYQQRSSGFPVLNEDWPHFLARNGFRQSAKQWGRAFLG